jgi:hypothetical protein
MHGLHQSINQSIKEPRTLQTVGFPTLVVQAERDSSNASLGRRFLALAACPHCEVHAASVREAYIDGALRDATDQLRGVI